MEELNEDGEIYRMNAQSADRLDERRDSAARNHAAVGIALTGVAAGALADYALVSAVLGGLIVATGFSWRATLDSLTAKLKAKNQALTRMEAEGKVYAFLTTERELWEELDTRPLQKAMKLAPWALVVIGAVIGVIAVTSLVC